MNSDTARILSVPKKKPVPEEMVELLSQEYLTPWAMQRGCKLLHTQAQGLVEYLLHGHGFFGISAGQGKTLLSLLITHIAYKEQRKLKILLIVPPALGVQLETTDMPMYREWAQFSFPVHWIIGRDAQKRKQTAFSGRYGLYVMAYSQLSGKDTEILLQAIAPELIILDEAHMLSKRTAARTTRFWKYLTKRSVVKAPKLVAMSGSLTQKSPMDFAMLANYSLGTDSFLPLDHYVLSQWSQALDAKADLDEYISPPDSCGLDKIYAWTKLNYPNQLNGKQPNTVTGLRAAFFARMRSTPGVVISDGKSAVSSAIVMRNMEAPTTEGLDKLKKIDSDLEKYYITPSGEQKSCAMEVWAIRWRLASGFYTENYWPEPEELMKVRKDIISIAQAKEYISRSQEHFAAWNDYKSELRKFLKTHHIQALDTPNLVGIHLHSHTKENGNKTLFGTDLPYLWNRAKKLEFPEIVARFKKTIRICDYKIQQCANYCKEYIKNEKRGLLVFYYHEEIGDWAEEIMTGMGLPVVRCKAGEQGSRLLSDPDKMRNKIALTAIGSHYQGKNLQYYDTIYYLEWYRTAKVVEQSIARCHRTSQESDVVLVLTNHTSEFEYKNFSASLTDSLYVQQSSHEETLRILQAHHDPKPKIFPVHVMEEIGLRVKPIRKEALELYKNKFNILT